MLVAWVLLKTCKHHRTETLFLFTIFLSMSRPNLFMSYLCDLFVIFIFIFFMINRLIPRVQPQLLFWLFFGICPIIRYSSTTLWVVEECQKYSNSKNSASGCYLAFVWFFINFSLALLIKVLLIKKNVYTDN